MADARACPCCGSGLLERELPFAYGECPRCGYRQRQQGVSADYYAQLQGRSRALEQEFANKYQERLLFLAPYLHAGDRVLEIGCADGELGRLLKAQSEVQVDGIELSADAEAAARVLDHVFRQPVEQVPVSGYQLILSFHVLEHVPDVLSHLAQLRRLLAPGASLVLEVPHGSGHPLLEHDRNPEHLHGFTVPSLSLLLQKQGFVIRALATGYRESGVYVDSLRVVAQAAATSTERRHALRQRWQRLPAGGVVVVGVGGDYQAYIQPNLGNFRCLGLADNAAPRIGSRIDGYPVQAAADYIQHFGQIPALIGSYRFRGELRQQLLGLGLADSAIFDLEQLLGDG